MNKRLVFFCLGITSMSLSVPTYLYVLYGVESTDIGFFMCLLTLFLVCAGIHMLELFRLEQSTTKLK